LLGIPLVSRGKALKPNKAEITRDVSSLFRLIVWESQVGIFVTEERKR